MARRGKRKLSEAQPYQQPLPNGTPSATAVAEPPAKRTQTRREVFVRGLASNVTSDTLVRHFSEAFPIKRGFVVTEPTTNQCKGYGFLSFADADDAAQAVTQFQNSTLAGRKIKLEVAEPRHRDVDDTLPAEVAAASGKNRSVPAPEAVAAKEKRRAELQAKKDEGRAPRLIVRNLPWSVKTEEDLSKLFLSYGKVTQAILPKSGPGRLRGFGFVLLRGRKNAEKALKNLNGKEIDGRQIAVDVAVDKNTWQGQAQQEVHTNVEKAVAQPGSEGDKVDGVSGGSDGGVDVSGSEGSLDGEVDGGADDESGVDEDEDEDEVVDENDDDDDEAQGDQNDDTAPEKDASPNTLFIRNLPFSTIDEGLHAHFTTFGPVRYARVVLDPETERPRGTGFVCFYRADDAKACLTNAPREAFNQFQQTGSNALPVGQSILQDERADPLGRYTLDGRVLQLARAVGKSQANHLANAGTVAQEQKQKEKRRLYLLNEGTISTKSAQWEAMSPAEKAMREASHKQRRALIQSNPSLHISLTRLSVRNIPRTVTSKALKELARTAVVGFATDVKAGKRERLSKEELNRGGDEMFKAEKERKAKKSGIVKQAKVVFETVQGAKAEEKEGGGRSRGYGFIEYYTHRSALMGLRWLNGHAIDYKAKETSKSARMTRDDLQDRKRRLIVEFAVDNAQVVHRRADREKKAREEEQQGQTKEEGPTRPKKRPNAQGKPAAAAEESVEPTAANKDLEKLKRRQQIIARKRAKRRGKAA